MMTSEVPKRNIDEDRSSNPSGAVKLIAFTIVVLLIAVYIGFIGRMTIELFEWGWNLIPWN